MNYILVGKNGKPSMRAVYELMKEDCALLFKRGEFFNLITKDKKTAVLTKLPVFAKGDKLIRWGNTIKATTDGGITYNKSAQIALGANKKKSRLLMQASGVAVPKTWDTIEQFMDDPNRTGPYIIRPTKHQQGKQLLVAQNAMEVEEAVMQLGNDSYISEFYPKTREFRVHVAHGKVLVMHEKPAPEDKNTVAWNRHVNHDAFKVIKWGDYDVAVAKLAIDTVKLLELDCAAVDILAYPEDKKLPKAVVCEVNSAPTLRLYAQTRYAAYFDWLLRKKTRREHWNSAEFKEPKSFAWKNFQLSDKKE